MVVRCPVRRLGIVRRDRSCMLEQWATIHRLSLSLHRLCFLTLSLHPSVSLLFPHTNQPLLLKHTNIPCGTELFTAIQRTTQDGSPSFPFIQHFYIDSRPSCHPHSPLTPRKHRLQYIVDHVDTHLDPLHHYSHWTHCRVSIPSTIEFRSLGFHRQTQVNIPIVWISVSQSQDHYSTPYTFRSARERSLNWISRW